MFHLGVGSLKPYLTLTGHPQDGLSIHEKVLASLDTTIPHPKNVAPFSELIVPRDPFFELTVPRDPFFELIIPQVCHPDSFPGL